MHPSGRSLPPRARRSRAIAVNRFLHVPTSPDDLVAKHEMQRELGQRTGTCFQRCVGLDAIGTCHSVTFDIDGKSGTPYHQRFLAFMRRAQARQRRDRRRDDRSEGRPLEGAAPSRPTPTCSCMWSAATTRASTCRGAKMHQTGAINSHWLILMPTMRMTEADRDWSVVGAVPVDAPGITYIYGRQTYDTRSLKAARWTQATPNSPGRRR